MAVAAFILGLLGFITICLILSVVFGIVALARIRQTGQRGRGLAIAGLIAAGTWAILYLVLIAFVFSQYRSPATSPVPQGTASVFSLLVGDYFQNPSAPPAGIKRDHGARGALPGPTQRAGVRSR